MAMEKHFNPFVLFGSYLGFLFGLLPISTIFLHAFGAPDSIFKVEFFVIPMYINPIYWLEMSSNLDAGSGGITVITTPFVLFIFGGFIHYQIKKRMV